MFSKTCEYAIKAALFVTQQAKGGKRVGVGEIALAIDSPEAFTAKILGQLVKLKAIQSVKGPNGGFEVPAAGSESIKLSDIVYAFDGDSLYNGCGLGLKYCNEAKPCPLHDKFVAIRSELKLMLEETTLSDLAENANNLQLVLKR
jgi:Rrf2 family protein